jgi:hypothetical protein
MSHARGRKGDVTARRRRGRGLRPDQPVLDFEFLLGPSQHPPAEPAPIASPDPAETWVDLSPRAAPRRRRVGRRAPACPGTSAGMRSRLAALPDGFPAPPRPVATPGAAPSGGAGHRQPAPIPMARQPTAAPAAYVQPDLGGTTMADAPRPDSLDRDAIAEGLQDQIDELTAAVAAQQTQLDALHRLVTHLASRAGIPVDLRTGH